MFAVAPAQAATTIYPQIQGLGSITGTYAGDVYSCSAPAPADPTTVVTTISTCSQALVGGLLGSTLGGTLTATPAAGYEFASWTNCPSGNDAPACTLGLLSALGGAPLATFVKVLDTGGGTGGTTDTLKTLLVSTPPATTGPDVSFLLGTDPADAVATFTCTLSQAGQPGAATPCGPSVSYTDLADGVYTFTALAKTSSLTGVPVSYMFTVASDTPLAPETTVTGGPRDYGWLLATRTKFHLSSNPSGATYACTLDGKALEGCTDPVEVTRLAQRTHVFKATATLLGVADSSPATRVFTVPVNNTKLTASKGWAKRRAKGHFLNTFSQTKRHGATLKVRRSAIRSVALVVTKGRGYGTVKVYLGKKLLKKVSLRANRTVGKRVVPIKKFSSKKHGTITVKVVSRGKLVRIEGLGVSSR